jgi:hypothetical protein
MLRYLFILIFLLIIQPSFAQQVPHLELSYGVLTSVKLFDLKEDVVQKVVNRGNYRTSEQRGSGGIFLAYSQFLNTRFRLGGTVGYEQIRQEVEVQGIDRGTVSRRFVTLAAEIAYHYLLRDKFSLYSRLGLGYTFGKEVFNQTQNMPTYDSGLNFPNAHLSLLGFRIGNRWAFFSEVGLGYRGIFQAGLSFQPVRNLQNMR